MCMEVYFYYLISHGCCIFCFIFFWKSTMNLIVWDNDLDAHHCWCNANKRQACRFACWQKIINICFWWLSCYRLTTTFLNYMVCELVFGFKKASLHCFPRFMVFISYQSVSSSLKPGTEPFSNVVHAYFFYYWNAIWPFVVHSLQGSECLRITVSHNNLIRHFDGYYSTMHYHRRNQIHKRKYVLWKNENQFIKSN